MLTWLANPWLVWGLGPYLTIVTASLTSMFVLELLIRLPAFNSAHISYSDKGERVPAGSGHPSRAQRILQTHRRIPFVEQLQESVSTTTGLHTMACSAGLSLLMRWVMPTPVSWLPASGVLGGALQLMALAVFQDLFTYCTHRASHEVPYLWYNHHRHHHRIDSPTAVSTVTATGVDAVIIQGLPIIVAFLICRPAPAAMYVFLAAHATEVSMNHSGLDSPLLNWLTLKALPLRTCVSFHDAHHKFEFRSTGAKNFAEAFWVWDWAFCTMM